MRVSLSNKSVKQITDALNGAPESNAPTVGQIIRALSDSLGKTMSGNSKDVADGAAILKSLNTGTGVGSYLVPVDAYAELLPALSRGNVLRRAGCTLIPMPRNQKIQIPVEGVVSDSETVFIDENAQVIPTNIDIQGRTVALKQLACMFEASANLARASKPAFDTICQQIMTRKIGRGVDFAFFSGKANGPVSLLNRASTIINSQTGSSLTYDDVTGLMEAAEESEGNIENYAFFASPLGLKKLRGVKDSNNRPILKSHLCDDGTTKYYSMLGHRLYSTPAIPNHVGSGSASTYMAFFDPANVLLCDGGIELAIAQGGQYFDRGAVGVRVINHVEFLLAHPESVAILENVR